MEQNSEAVEWLEQGWPTARRPTSVTRRPMFELVDDHSAASLGSFRGAPLHAAFRERAIRDHGVECTVCGANPIILREGDGGSE